MLEKDLYKRLYQGANSEDWALYRIGDGTWGRKPFDLGGVGPNGEAVALEVKVVGSFQHLKPLPWQRFAPHQIEWLRTYAVRDQALAIVGIYFETARKLRLYRMRGLRFCEVRAMDHPSHELLLKDGQYVGWNEFLAMCYSTL